MPLRTLCHVGLALLGLLVAGCSGGSSPTNFKAAPCNTGSKFCLSSCNLGCTTVGCAITDIAQNQPIELVFSEPVDPKSVNGASVSLQTASGEPPTGQLLVSGNKITFEPEIRIIGGVTMFGFRANETYILTLPGGPGESQALRSVSGGRFGATVTCPLTVSRGVIDLDGAPPVGTLVQPTNGATGVSQNTSIVLEFSEIIDTAPFQGATTATSPVLYRLRRTHQVGNHLECDPNQLPVDLGGSPIATVQAGTRKTQVLLRPPIQLPSEACVEVEITSRVKDLSGKSAVPVVYSFITDKAAPVDQDVSELFASNRQLDRSYSSGTWGNGEARPGLIGGDGSLGEFDVSIGNEVSPDVYEWNTDSMTIPGTLTASGMPETVTDGVFRFSRFVLNGTDTLKFVGSKPPRILVRGEALINGTIDLSAPQMAGYTKEMTFGQPGGLGGPGGGAGGKGGDLGSGLGHEARFDGSPGDDVRLPAGHAYLSRAMGTGGQGSVQYPLDGLNSSITYNGLSSLFSAQMAAGGGGGGFIEPGANGRVISTLSNETGPEAPGGKLIDLFPIPAGTSSVDHFLIGGAGGGGAGSHCFFTTASMTEWRCGAGGAGGGGALNLRVGGKLDMAGGSMIAVRGGRGVTPMAVVPPGPGGGGSGGSALVQVGGTANMGGTIDASGGVGGSFNDPAVFMLNVTGGMGGGGYVRLEVPSNPSIGLLGTTIPAATANNVGTLTDTDAVVGDQSLFYATRQVFAPRYLRYELQVLEDNTPVVYSDDPSWTSSFGPNVGLASATRTVHVQVQGAHVSASTGAVDPSTVGPWRDYVAPQPGADDDLNDDDATGFRFKMIYDRTTVKDIVVKKFAVYFRS